ncbi:hypothetical protein MVES_000123 [Malassezia vespertilionis]|uniref:Ero1p n=2 Tax=Malassezia vespertilionis TaxID=2020962 RepID=A0A2N1JFT6_9BASI|nr:hypothetical protein MVES_000123 [Malassezia vespertilionis]
MNETDIPEQFRAARLGEVKYVGKEEGESVSDSGANVNFCYLDDGDSSTEAAYVDLLKNPERFTGYSGVSANRVWRSIYEENCFNSNKFRDPPSSAAGGTGFISPHQVKMASKHGLGGALSMWNGGGLDTLIQSVEAPEDPGSTEHCLEKRVFYRIISGLHASISIHICSEYLDPATNTWGPNLECFLTRIAQHPERLQNVYFDYVLLMRALSKAGEYLDRFELREGDQIKDADTKKQLEELLRHAGANRPSFDEHNLFAMTNDPVKNRATLQLKEDFRSHFMNVSRIMDCVGCDKCRLWGKLQFAGIGTALKLLFAFEETASQTSVTLRRTELVALINTAHRISESIHAVDTFRNLYQESAHPEEKYNAPPGKPPSERPNEHVSDTHSLLHKIAHAVRHYLALVYRRLSTPQADL